MDNPTLKDYAPTARVLLTLLTAIAIIFVLFELRSFLLPLGISVLLAYLLTPLCNRLEKWGLNRMLAIVMAMLVLAVVLTGLGILLVRQINLFAQDVPQLLKENEPRIDDLQRWIEQQTHMNKQEQLKWLQQQREQTMNSVQNMAGSMLDWFTEFIGALVLVPVYIFLLLLYRVKFYDFVLMSTPASRHDRARQLMADIQQVLQKYLQGLLMVMAILAIITSVGFLAIGVKYAIFLSILIAVGNLVPYIGLALTGGFAVLISLLTAGNMQQPLMTLGVIWLTQLIEGNFLTPRIVGSQVNVNALMVIMGIILMGMLWGVPGMVLAIPIMGALRVYVNHEPQLTALNFLISETTPKRIDKSKEQKRRQAHNVEDIKGTNPEKGT